MSQEHLSKKNISTPEREIFMYCPYLSKEIKSTNRMTEMQQSFRISLQTTRECLPKNLARYLIQNWRYKQKNPLLASASQGGQLKSMIIFTCSIT